MLALPLNTTDEAIMDGLSLWLRLLMHEDYQTAFDLTYHPTGDRWTPESLREQIHFYGDRTNEKLQIPPADTTRQPEHHVQRANANAAPPQVTPGGRLIGSYESLVTARNREDPTFLGEAVLQLPFGGKWSDVFATFVMINHRERLVLYLKSIYIH